LINQAPINAGPINAVTAAQGGAGLSISARFEIVASVRPVPPLFSMLMDQSQTLVFTVEIYPAFIPDRVVEAPNLTGEGGGLLVTEGGRPIGVDG